MHIRFYILLCVEEVVRYNYRLRPGAMAVAALTAEWGRCRWLWNEAVHQQRSGRKPTFFKLCKLLTEARAANAWLRAGSQVVQQQVLRTYAIALNQSFAVKGRGRPTLKKKTETLPTLEYTVRGFSIKEGRLCLPRGVTVPVVWSRDLPSEPSSVRVFQDSLGHWYASFVVRREQEPAPEATAGIGIDWGVTTTAATTDPAYDLPHHDYRRRCAAELAKAQRKMARRRPPRGHASSKGYLRAKRQAAKLHKKAARQNQHTARLWVKSVVDNHAVIAVEDFKPAFLARSSMARKAADAAIGAAKRELVERGTRAGRKVAHVRTFVCASCGLRLCRDVNAARNILAAVERDRAGADGVRHVDTSLRGACSDAA